MAKRLQVILQDAEYREIQRAARSRRMSLAEWVRQALELARRSEPVGNVGNSKRFIRLCGTLILPGKLTLCWRKSKRATRTRSARDLNRFEHPYVHGGGSPPFQGASSATAGEFDYRAQAACHRRRSFAGDSAPVCIDQSP